MRLARIDRARATSTSSSSSRLPEGAYSDAYFGLLEALGRLFDRPIDLVVASAIRNPYFRKAVEGSKKLLYAA